MNSSYYLVVVFGVFCAWMMRNMLEPTYCTLEEDAECPERFFSQSYFEARTKFRLAAKNVGAELIEMHVYADPSTQIEYTTDVAIIEGTRTDEVFIVYSGVHGPEGYAGSAIQLSVLDRWATKTKHVTTRPTIVFVHALNPFGMANGRRWNENNVDLNRNLLSPEEWEMVRNRDPNIAGYEDWDEVFNPTERTTVWTELSYIPRTIVYIVRYGVKSIMKAMVAGTYSRPKGIFYGGDRLQQSHVNMIELVKSRFANTTRKLSLMDLHTGLGPPGQPTIITTDSTSMDMVRKVFADHPEEWLDEPTKATTTVTSGAYALTVGFTDNMHRYFPHVPAKNALMFTVEYGTIAPPLVARALIFENAAYHNERDSYHHRQTNQWIRDAFYLPSVVWKKRIVSTGTQLFYAALENFFSGADA